MPKNLAPILNDLDYYEVEWCLYYSGVHDPKYGKPDLMLLNADEIFAKLISDSRVTHWKVWDKAKLSLRRKLELDEQAQVSY